MYCIIACVFWAAIRINVVLIAQIQYPSLLNDRNRIITCNCYLFKLLWRAWSLIYVTSEEGYLNAVSSVARKYNIKLAFFM